MGHGSESPAAADSDVLAWARQVLAARYRGAAAAFAAGSLIRDQGADGTATSDLDLVIIFDQLPHAWRESFVDNARPVEAFIHDPQTLTYFMAEVDCKSGYPCLPHMITTGVAIPAENELSQQLVQQAQGLLDTGPPPLDPEQLAWQRYLITDALDDLVAPKNAHEATATAAALYDTLANLYLRSRGRWSGKGKWLPRLLAQADPAFVARFTAAFENLFRHGDAKQLATLAEEALTPVGGLFRFSEGYRRNAPAAWRSPSYAPASARIP